MGSSPFKTQAASVAIGKIRLIKAAFSHTEYINLLAWLSVMYLKKKKKKDPNCIKQEITVNIFGSRV